MNLGQVFLFIAIFSMIFTLPTIPSSYAIELPNWLKPIAIWWGEGKVTDDEFVGIIQWMLDNGLINIKESVDNDQDGYDSDIDCNDNNSTIYPGANDIPNDGIDQDCDGFDAKDIAEDKDFDHYFTKNTQQSLVDCDDNDPSVFPGSPEIANDGKDNDCDGTVDEEIDNDQDGYDSDIDCNDNNSTIYPGANDIPNDGIDQDCDGFDAKDVAEDKDFDHYFTKNTQQSLVDCDDNDPSVFPGAPEIANDGKDNDCDGTVDEEIDNDQDGYNSDIDCNDNDNTIYPGANDIPNDGIDQDCDGMDAQGADDNDGDGYDVNLDCNDNDSTIYPGANDIPNDGIDQDCDGMDAQGIDTDGDGYDISVDCNDHNSTIYPGANDIPNDGIDQDCDGMDAVDNDGDGYNSNVDCDDNDPRINPGAPEIPTDGVDNDCDGTVDEG